MKKVNKKIIYALVALTIILGGSYTYYANSVVPKKIEETKLEVESSIEETQVFNYLLIDNKDQKIKNLSYLKDATKKTETTKDKNGKEVKKEVEVENDKKLIAAFTEIMDTHEKATKVFKLDNYETLNNKNKLKELETAKKEILQTRTDLIEEVIVPKENKNVLNSFDNQVKKVADTKLKDGTTKEENETFAKTIAEYKKNMETYKTKLEKVVEEKSTYTDNEDIEIVYAYMTKYNDKDKEGKDVEKYKEVETDKVDMKNTITDKNKNDKDKKGMTNVKDTVLVARVKNSTINNAYDEIKKDKEYIAEIKKVTDKKAAMDKVIQTRLDEEAERQRQTAIEEANRIAAEQEAANAYEPSYCEIYDCTDYGNDDDGGYYEEPSYPSNGGGGSGGGGICI